MDVPCPSRHFQQFIGESPLGIYDRLSVYPYVDVATRRSRRIWRVLADRQPHIDIASPSRGTAANHVYRCVVLVGYPLEFGSFTRR